MASATDPRPARAAIILVLSMLAPASAPGQDLPTTLPERARPAQSQPQSQPQPQTQPEDEVDDRPVSPPAPAVPQPTPAANPDPAQETDPGRRIMLEASRAIRDLQSLSYRSRFYGSGAIEQIAPRCEGLVRMVRSDRNERVWLLRATGAGVPKEGDPEISFDVVWQEAGVEWIDHDLKEVVVRPVRQAKGPAYQVAGPVRLLELQDAAPLSKELQAEGFTLEEPAELDGVPCQVVLITLPGGRTQMRWWIAETDHLPRKMSRLFSGPHGSGEMVIELSEVTPQAPVNAADMRIPTPSGYTRDESGTSLAPPVSARRDNGPAAAPDAPGAAGPAAPPFELPSAAGGKVSLSSLAGNVVVLQFWGTWHLPSRAACADLQALAAQFEQQKVKVFACSVRERSDDTPRDFVRSAGYTFGVLLDADQTAETYGVVRYPTYAVIGPGGELLDTIVGYKKDETLKKLAESVARALAAMHPAQATGPAPANGG